MKSGPEQIRLWDDFLKEWPLERLSTMSLPEYTTVADDHCLTRWLESRLSEMGSIWGGSAFKFGIFHRKAEEEKPGGAGRSYSEDYGWYTKYGNTPENAFNKVRELVASTAIAAREGALEKVEAIDLGDAFRWKIAFHYQDRANPLITPVFSRPHLRAYLGGEGKDLHKYADLYRRLNEMRSNEDVLEFGSKVWEEASKTLAAEFTPEKAENLLKQRYRLYSEPTKKSAGFTTPAGRSLALRRGRKAVLIFVEANAHLVEGVTVSKTYSPETPRSSNLPSQAPNLGVGNPALLLHFASAPALEEFCDVYDEAKASAPPIAAPKQQTQEVQHLKSLNQILYGPPGTGKTYKTCEIAVRICDGQADQDREKLMYRYEELRLEGRIRFVTFHQSYSYEDFVEGLRPELKDGQVFYRVRPGIFREACDAARRSGLIKPGIKGKPLAERTFYKMSLGTAGTPEGNKVFQEAIEKGYVMLGWGEDVDFSQCVSIEQMKAKVKEDRPDLQEQDSHTRYAWLLKNELKTGDIIVVSQGNRAFRAIGEVTGDYEFLESSTYNQARPVRWLGVFEGNRSVREIYDRDFMMSTLYRLDREGLNLSAIDSLLNARQDEANQSFVLIIDEINRANISKVIGELITLLEPDKREGELNALRVKLPYSGDDFSVPGNLFILGTMNTADRSIALLDTALRRRFDFVELRPDSSQIAGVTVEGINLPALMIALNARVEYLYDRDHVIGHAYFMNARTLQELEDAMRRRVIPLLQEYFYEDWSKVRIALNDHAGLFIETEQTVLDTKVATDDLEGKTRYQVRAERFPVQAYLNIYS